MSRLRLALIGLFSLVFLAGCGQATLTAWPGLATNNELAFVASGGQVTAVNLADGKKRWAYPAAAGQEQFFTDPGVSADAIVVSTEGPTGQHSGALIGLNPQDGAQKWCLAFDDRAAQRLNCPAIPGASKGFSLLFLNIEPPVDNRMLGGVAITDGVAYFGLANNAVFAVDAATGKGVWDRPYIVDHPAWATPLVSADTVYITSLDHAIYALNRANGALKWKKDLGAALAGTPTLVNNVLYIGTFGRKLYALDAASGAEKWTAPASNWVWAGPAVVSDTVYFSDLSGGLFAVDAATGAQKWTVTPGGVLRGTPAIANGLALIGDKDGKLYARNLSDGSEKWNQAVSGGGQLLGSPVALPDKDLVLVAPYQGSNLLVAYTTTGTLKWAYAPSK